ncbi:hypothetical protein FRC01_010609 [Tulasnella sp. 417]|nr:hypothetical protein FRC01_010609 [Tulasnella sp. 417]
MVDPFNQSVERLRRIEALLNLFNRRPEVKSWIRILYMGQTNISRRRTRDDDHKNKYIAIEPKIHNLVPGLRGLNLLVCGIMSFSSSLFSDILQLPNLDKLQLVGLQFSQNTSDQMQDWNTIDHNRSPLRSLNVRLLKPPSAETTQALLHLLQRETLTELTSRPYRFRELEDWITLPPIIFAHIPDYVFTSLRKLNIVLVLGTSDVEVQHFTQFGARCPNLVSLTIRSLFEETPRELDVFRRSSLAEHPFPTLQEFSGSLTLAPSLVQGRPVRRVIGDILRINERNRGVPSMPSNIVALKPSVPLRVLHLTTRCWNDDDIEAVAQQHPGLEELVYEDLSGKILDWSARAEDGFRKLGNLKRFTLGNGEDLEVLTDAVKDDDYLIVKLRSACPNIQWARFSWLGIWKLCP